jgi:hypothetical protein
MANGDGTWEDPSAYPKEVAAGIARQEKFISDAAVLKEYTRDCSTRQIIDWSWLRIQRHFGFHYDEMETAIELRLPWKVRYAQGGPWKINISRSYVIVFGRVHTRLVRTAWHMRGSFSTWETPWL